MSMEERMAVLESRVALLEGCVNSGGSPPVRSNGGPGKEVASDYDLDSEHGDQVVRKDPKRWVEQGGDSYAGCKMSECPAEYLDAVANLFDWMADRDDEAGRKGETYFNKKQNKDVPKDGAFKRKDAARARGWAKRNRDRFEAGEKVQQHAARASEAPPAPPAANDDYGSNPMDDCPF